MERPILNPPNPYIGTMRVFPGTLLKVAGTPRYGAQRFAINLQTGPSINPRDDLALHLGACFNPPKLIRNSLVNSSWGPEESGGPFLFASGHPFEIMILCEEHKFKIAINGNHFCEFSHRTSFEEVTHLSIDGDVDITRITVTDNNAPVGEKQSLSAAGIPSAASVGPPPLPGGGMFPSIPPPVSSSGGPAIPPPYPGVPAPVPQTGYGGSGYQQPSSLPYPNIPVGPTMSGPGYPTGGPPPTAAGFPSTGGYGQPSGYPGAAYPGATPGPAYPGAAPYYSQQPGQGYQQPGAPSYPQGSYGQHGPPQQGQHPQSSNSLFNNLPTGVKTLAGLGLGAAAGAAALSVVSHPFKKVKKALKPKFKAKGWGRSSSSSSNSSRSSFSSNSS